MSQKIGVIKTLITKLKQTMKADGKDSGEIAKAVARLVKRHRAVAAGATGIAVGANNKKKKR